MATTRTVSITDSATATSLLTAGQLASVSLMGSAFAYSGVGTVLLFKTSIKDNVTATESISPKQILKVLIEDSATVYVNLVFRGQQFDGWVVNLNNFASSRYVGLNANSFCQYQGQYYACMDNGIHSLGADTDDGVPIDALISTGNIKPFFNSLSRVFDAYLLVKNDGDMQIRVIAQGEIYSYRIENLSSFHKESRVKLGKGVKSAIWRFEIANLEGSDFDLESFKIYPIELSRHI